MISVLIPVYRVPLDWFREALASVDQELDRFQADHPTLPGPELLIVVDGSDQADLLGFLEEYRARNARTSVVFNPTNTGVAGALDVGLKACEHDLVARFDADDVMLPGRLEAQYREMERDYRLSVLGTGLNYMHFHGDRWVVDPRPVLHPAEVTREVAMNSLWFMNHPTVMMRRERVLEAGGYDGSLKGMAEDYELWVRLIRNGLAMRNLQQTYHLLRLNPSSASRNFDQKNHQFLLDQQAKLRNDV